MAKDLIKTLKRKINSAFYVALRLVNYYPYYSYLHGRGQKINLTPEYELEFTPQEKAFLKACAASYNYIESDYALGHRQKELSLYKLRDVTFFSHTGVIMIGQKLIVESGLSVDRLTQTKSFRDFALLIPRVFRHGSYSTIQHSHWADNNIYHWYIDCIPRIFILVNTLREPTTLLMWQDAHLYQKQTVEYILRDYPHISIKYLRRQYRIKIKNFYLPSYAASSFSGYLPPQVSDWIRERVWAHCEVNLIMPKQRLYISRSGANTRHISNEIQLVPILEKFGFIIVRPEELDYKQQIQLFFNAEAIVAPHGAGLTNVLFAQKCYVIEFQPKNIIKPLYMLLCKGLDFEYTSVLGSYEDKKGNFTVPVEVVESLLHTKYIS